MTDLEQRIFLAIAKSMPTKQPAAVLAEIERTHVLVERSLVKLAYNAKRQFGKGYEREVVASQLADYWTGDLEPIRHAAAESDTPEIT